MPRERLESKASHLGQHWLMDSFAWKTGEQWQDARMVFQDHSFSVSPNGNGTQTVSSQVTTTELFCHGVKVAEVSKTSLENGAEAVEINPVPEIAFCEIDPSLLENISRWANKQTNGEDLCREIKDFCRGKSQDGILFSTVSLWVFLSRKEAIRWG